MDEIAIIDRFFRPLAGEGAFGLRDDAARLIVPEDRELVITTDMIACDVHFLPGDPAGDIARKALRVNLSDLAAKGAEPLAYVLAMGLAALCDESWLAAFAAGLAADQEEFGIALLGGDTIAVAAGPVISVTAFGTAPRGRMVHRFGGQPGDSLYVSGRIGESACGLALLTGQPGSWDALPDEGRQHLIARYRIPEPRLALAPALVNFASAAMDVSDGLVGDCDKLARVSGCAALIRAESVPLHPGLLRDADLLARLLTSGDDYEVLAAVPPENEAGFRAEAARADVQVTRIGELRSGHGVTQVEFEGGALPLATRSYVHRQAG